MPDRGATAFGEPLPESFFARDTVTVARELLGKIVVSRIGGREVAGRIVETEAYLGANDPGSHASTKGVTPRNTTMYGPPGHAYVYFTYGNHHMLNLVTEAQGVAGAVLLRALEPVSGLDVMLARRSVGRAARRIGPHDVANGPGKLAQALAVDIGSNGLSLQSGTLGVYDSPPPDECVGVSGRVGLSEGHELELRFYLHGSPFVSRGRTGPKPPRAGRGREEGRR